ncbi:hypothetical protein H5410_046579 [Solanum commersonii]|uniref:Uncharacterized protein n=1 Tax=Solanum commersonii TaxID=4109 RepID=A0A9J5XCN5_SOLCO|nr:hypothetical protein H5410_046579 [Solanum commersonii]
MTTALTPHSEQRFQQQLHASSRRITARALKLRPTTMYTKKQAKSSAMNLTFSLVKYPDLNFFIKTLVDINFCKPYKKFKGI